ncbi:MerR family transcriptional regulator [Paucibacter aquatile]|uniref:MerR family transcriptional regulator n=1 Tax=Kinneretia aquatilis TaxID=2070761 RepID=A0A2N8KX98_9BURK|nr:MerR family transcriptional regulator [Paucibacter aquatile]PND38022.1 MerR family transcriptional regulator [Paucibacter aquatile]
MQIGELSARTGLSRDTLRFYEKRGLLRARRSDNGYRDYPPEAVRWLGYVRMAQGLGFSLAEIEADLPRVTDAQPAATADELQAVLARKLQEIDARIAGLQGLRAELLAQLQAPQPACPLRGVRGEVLA